jgi:hypothetical protein
MEEKLTEGMLSLSAITFIRTQYLCSLNIGLVSIQVFQVKPFMNRSTTKCIIFSLPLYQSFGTPYTISNIPRSIYWLSQSFISLVLSTS